MSILFHCLVFLPELVVQQQQQQQQQQDSLVVLVVVAYPDLLNGDETGRITIIIKQKQQKESPSDAIV